MSENLPSYAFYEGAPETVPVAHSADSLLKLERAAALGYNYAEVNVVSTSDGVAVAFHGPEWWQTQSTLPRRETIESVTSRHARNFMVDDEPIATLEELMTASPDMRFFIDLKTPAAVRPVARIINKLSLHDRVSVGGTRYDYTQAVREEVQPDGFICTNFGTVGSIAMLLTRFRFSSRWAEDYIRQSSATQFMLPFGLVRSDTTQRAHERGRRVFVWTPNSERGIAGSVAKGVDGIVSDKFVLLKRLAEQAS